jgi:hypothetical protein
MDSTAFTYSSSNPFPQPISTCAFLSGNHHSNHEFLLESAERSLAFFKNEKQEFEIENIEDFSSVLLSTCRLIVTKMPTKEGFRLFIYDTTGNGIETPYFVPGGRVWDAKVSP